VLSDRARYGGVWINSGRIVMRPLEEVLALLTGVS
jgi:hypothetical protein